MVKNSSANAADSGSIPGLGRFPGEGNDNPLLAQEIPWTEASDGLQSMVSQKRWT